MPAQSHDFQTRFTGLLLGTAVGDALGLPAENLSPMRIRRLWNGEWRMRFVFGRGMLSDDTEHTLMAAQALLAHPDDSAAFQRSLGWKFRWWFACLPGGVGLATAKACVRLWLGFGLSRSAVNSAGSGPAMRSAIIGAYFAHDLRKRREFVTASSCLTHKGWQAETAALTVAEAAAFAVTCKGSSDGTAVLRTLRVLSAEPEWMAKVFQMEQSLARGDTVADFVRALGLENGVSGYSLHVVPVAIYAWLKHTHDYRAALISVLECGGDTDTVGAILGALCGATGGVGQIPDEWLGRIAEWPRTIPVIRQMASRLAEQVPSGRATGEVAYFWPGLLLRNIFFIAVVLVHGFRRLLPPY